jgi:hypothetical protein
MSTDYNRYKHLSGYDVLPESLHYNYEPPVIAKTETKLEVEFPATPSKLFHFRGFTVNSTHKTDEEDVIFWGAFWLVILGITLQVGLYIGHREE